MDYTNYLEDAIAQVDAWDLPEAEFAEAVNDQARLMAGQGMEPWFDTALPSPYAALRF